jgi:hypothetical protein
MRFRAPAQAFDLPVFHATRQDYKVAADMLSTSRAFSTRRSNVPRRVPDHSERVGVYG